MVFGHPQHVHENHGDIIPGRHFGDFAIQPERPHVIDDGRPRPLKPLQAHLRLCGVDGNGGCPTFGARLSIMGTTRRISSFSSTPSEKGRVDSPPISRMSAPSAASFSPWATAFFTSKKMAAVGKRNPAWTFQHRHDPGFFPPDPARAPFHWNGKGFSFIGFRHFKKSGFVRLVGRIRVRAFGGAGT